MVSDYLKRVRSGIGHDLLLIPSVAAVIHDVDGRLLLQEKASGEGWSLPAGSIEPGESPEAALVRETLEETGLTVTRAKIVGCFGGEAFRYVYPNGDAVEYTVILFRCVVSDKPSAISDPETRRLSFFGRAEMPALALPYPPDTLFGDDTHLAPISQV